MFLKTLIEKFFSFKHKTELERFIESRDPQTPEQLEFWMAEFDNRQRIINTLRFQGRHDQANWYSSY